MYELDPEEVSPTFPRCRARWKMLWMPCSAIMHFLLKGEVFTEELIRTYVDYKRSKEVKDPATAASL